MGKPKSRRVFMVALEQEDDGRWSVSVPALPGCYSQGDTLEEAKANAGEAIRAYLASQKKDHVPLSDPSRGLITNSGDDLRELI